KKRREGDRAFFWCLVRIQQAQEDGLVKVLGNQDFSGWAEIFEDPIQVSTMLDRLLHHCLAFNIKGDSFRVRANKPKGGREN
ncbi:MAG: ATP-binding protein, partial [Acidobacteriota bacterium]